MVIVVVDVLVFLVLMFCVQASLTQAEAAADALRRKVEEEQEAHRAVERRTRALQQEAEHLRAEKVGGWVGAQ
jgi:hypothetical protein